MEFKALACRLGGVLDGSIQAFEIRPQAFRNSVKQTVQYTREEGLPAFRALARFTCQVSAYLGWPAGVRGQAVERLIRFSAQS